MFVATVVLVVVAIALPVGVPIWRQQVLLHEIERLGGLYYTSPRGPDWLRQWIGEEQMAALDDVVRVELDYSHDLADADLVPLQQLRKLEQLSLLDTRITDAGLADVARLTTLKHLTLTGAPISDRGLVHLRRLTNLEILELARTGVTDNGLKHLTDLTRLQFLSLAETHVTDAGIDELGRALPHLTIYR